MRTKYEHTGEDFSDIQAQLDVVNQSDIVHTQAGIAL
jgi:hypothetical protein